MSSAVYFGRALQTSIRQRAVVLVCGFGLFSSLTQLHSFAQQKSSQRAEQSRLALPPEGRIDDVLRIDTDLIAVDVRVLDRDGRPVRNLMSEHDRQFRTIRVEALPGFTTRQSRPGYRANMH
jgi:hypothetical protein